MESKSEAATYTHGHHASVLRSHTWRTALNSAAYLLPHLKPSMKILDIGCGPGTITVDIAANHVPQGHVTGLERESGVLEQARALAKEKGVQNVDFVVGDANALEFGDDTFDVVVCHQVLQHVKDPVGILREMRRVTKKGGIVAAREADFGFLVWYPEVDGMKEWQTMYGNTARANGGEPLAGRMLHAWAKKAGFDAEAISCESSTWCYSKKEEIAWWSGLWAERTVASSFAKTAIENGTGTQENLEHASNAWKAWGREEDAWFSIAHGEIICRK
ncbi:S-adenosyl-L-methionine-dependent methyltransferase [Plectosphaerella plurivora]|uniref:S-adenosyl-L-methionine-dependent methyltransferase n=1 Tax=Plectosphaerella plurivora TaxID=936078 RepID=A0A9P8V5F4_9PEZI|nr:S-adenosyl-L-methionine-dependent methyltransferase [Plectosphaerella plurivora]